MDLLNLEEGLRSVASGGRVLSCQELSCLQASLQLLKSKERLQNIFFWGKLFGQVADYYIAYYAHHSEQEFPSKTFYYSGEDFQFRPLPRLTEAAAERVLALALDTPFHGIPGTHLHTEGETTLTEVDRLAQVVQEIDFDTAVVPKGAHVLTEAHVVEDCRTFKGLSAEEATLPANYVHFRPPASVAALRALARTDAEFFSSFLDSLDSDLPRGCWAVRKDPVGQVVTLRSLSWPGYAAYHLPETTRFGGAYFGYAQKTRDLAFLL